MPDVWLNHVFDENICIKNDVSIMRCSRYMNPVCRSSNEGIVGSLEVVTLSGDAPVKRFAQHHKLPLQIWPPQKVEGRFDVGVVVSFGCLLPESLINKFPQSVFLCGCKP